MSNFEDMEQKLEELIVVAEQLRGKVRESSNALDDAYLVVDAARAAFYAAEKVFLDADGVRREYASKLEAARKALRNGR